MHGSFQRRLLNDIADIQQDPYPDIYLRFDDTNIQNACLILTPESYGPLHLTMHFPPDYPMTAPRVSIQSTIVHPNVYGEYICASILNTYEGWTSAYTLRGIVIQLLSFFASDSLEQMDGYHAVHLATHRRSSRRNPGYHRTDKSFSCEACNFGPDWSPEQSVEESSAEKMDIDCVPRPHCVSKMKTSKLFSLPDEVILLLLANLDTRDVLSLAEAVPAIKTMVYSYDFIRVRELQCFCLKESFKDAKLGIGVSINPGRRPVFHSEFDLLSQEAFFQHNVRKSVQGVRFDKWLLLPLSRHHWNHARGTASACLSAMHKYARMSDGGPDHVDVLYHFMNNVVVQLSADAEKAYENPEIKSTLSHASEKAVEAYFGLFHLLLCLATENPAVVTNANQITARFLAGPRTKVHFPDLGHVLVAALISNDGLTEELTFQIIKEAILRNVVWMLDLKGAGLAELGYLEPSAVSDYRLIMTFHASKTSYRLLMILKLFSSSARPSNKSLVQLREALFDTHGAPPRGVAAKMAQQIRSIREVNGFPQFLKAMGIHNMPTKTEFTSFLRRTITDSVKAGYSRMPMSQSQLYTIRNAQEPGVEKVQGVFRLDSWYAKGEKWYFNGWNGRPSFFPNGEGDRRSSHEGGARFGGRDYGRGYGRGRGRGRGRGGRS